MLKERPGPYNFNQTISDLLDDKKRNVVALCGSSPTNERGVKTKKSKDGSKKWVTNNLIKPSLFVARLADKGCDAVILVNTTSVLPAGIEYNRWEEELEANNDVFRILCGNSLKLVLMIGCMFPKDSMWKNDIGKHACKHKTSLVLPQRTLQNTFVLLRDGDLVSGKYSASPLRKTLSELCLGRYDTFEDIKTNPNTYKISLSAITPIRNGDI